MLKSIFFYATVSLERTEKGVKIVPNQDFVKEIETYKRASWDDIRAKSVIQKITLGEIPEFEYPSDMDIKDIERDLKDKGILSKVNTNKYRLKESYVNKLLDEIKMEKDEEKLANAAQVSPEELDDMQETAKEVVADTSIPQNRKVAETLKRVDAKKKKKPWLKKKFNKKGEDYTENSPIMTNS